MTAFTVYVASIGPAIATEQIAASCSACHVGDMSLANRSREELIEMLAGMAAGERPHPTDLTVLDEEDIRSLVGALVP